VAGGRRLVERLSRGVVLRRSLPRRFGGARLYVTPDASLRFWRPGLGHVDPRLLALVEELVRTGDSVWDIGSNVGLFAFSAAHRATNTGHVLAVEADPLLASLLKRSSAIADRPGAPVEVLHAAIADSTGVARFAIAERGRATSHLIEVGGSTQTGGARFVTEVPCLTLDSLLQGRLPPALVKVDVEGAELLALRGGAQLLSTARPRILCEVSAENRDEVGALLHGFDYRLFDADLSSSERPALGAPAWNTLAMPA